MSMLDIRKLSVSFGSHSKRRCVVDEVSLSIQNGEVMGLVGESGSGKSVTAQAIILPTGRIDKGEIWFEGENLLLKSHQELRAIRGKQIGMVFQDPLSSLNPTMTIGEQIIESLLTHEKMGKTEANLRVIEILERVGVPEAPIRLRQYPFELSGGMRQRVLIASALICRPRLLIADEPTTALDATIQAQIIELLKSLRSQFKMSILLITHDLGVAAGLCDKLAIMHHGKIVEQGEIFQVFNSPKHPYTQQLLAMRRFP